MTNSPSSPPPYLLWTETRFQGQSCKVNVCVGAFSFQFLTDSFQVCKRKQILLVMAFEPQVICVLLKQKTSIKKTKQNSRCLADYKRNVLWRIKEMGGRYGRKSLRIRIEGVPAN